MIIPMADRIQYDLSNDSFVECGNVGYRKLILIMLDRVTRDNLVPDLIITEENPPDTLRDSQPAQALPIPGIRR